MELAKLFMQGRKVKLRVLGLEDAHEVFSWKRRLGADRGG
jgi:hypothetical protein